MRLLVAIVMAALGAASVLAQEGAKAQIPSKSNRCEPLGGLLNEGDPNDGRLFIWHEKVWKKIEYRWLQDDLELPNYHSEKLHFIYVAPPSNFRGRQFLSVRTIADANENTRVNLRKETDPTEDTVNFGAYVDYHDNGKPITVLRRYHAWPDGSRSDDPEQTRMAWSFKSSRETARRRVLAVSYVATDRIVCVPFTLGPNISSVDREINGEDIFQVDKGFKIEITEAKTGSGSSGRTFTVHSAKSKR